MEVSILSVEDSTDESGATATYYVISVSKAGKSWTVRRRYSAFDDLRKSVSKEMGGLASPFPGKSLFGRADPKKREAPAQEPISRGVAARCSLPAAAGPSGRLVRISATARTDSGAAVGGGVAAPPRGYHADSPRAG